MAKQADAPPCAPPPPVEQAADSGSWSWLQGSGFRRDGKPTWNLNSEVVVVIRRPVGDHDHTREFDRSVIMITLGGLTGR